MIAAMAAFGRAFSIRILDAQQHLAAEPARVQPVEQRRAGPPDMQETGGRGGETRYDGVGHIGLSNCACVLSPRVALRAVRLNRPPVGAGGPP